MASHRLNILYTLHTAVRCDWFGNEGVGIHRWAVSGNEVVLSWQRFYALMEARFQEKVDRNTEVDNECPPVETDDIKNPFLQIPVELGIIEKFEDYLILPQETRIKIPHKTAMKTSSTETQPVVEILRSEDTTDSTEKNIAEISDEIGTGTIFQCGCEKESVESSDFSSTYDSSSDFDTDISVDEDGEFIVKTLEERRLSRKKASSLTAPKAEEEEIVMEGRTHTEDNSTTSVDVC